MAPITIKVNRNGPYLIQGTDMANDGTHSRIGFKGAEEARRQLDAERQRPATSDQRSGLPGSADR